MARVSFVGTVLRLAAFALVGIGVTIALAAAVPAIGGERWSLARNGLYQLVGFLAATVLLGRVGDRYTWDRLGWRPLRALPRHFAHGLLFGVGLAAVAVLLAVLLDGAVLRLSGVEGFPGVAAALLVGFGAAALSEELMWRGYPLRRLADAIGPWVATVVLAIGFGVAHLWNAGTSVLSTVNIAVAGVWLGVAFFSRGGMALAWGLHLGWNAGLSLVFDAPVSGEAFNVPGMDYVPGAHPWLDGGRFGPEGGLLGTVVFATGVLLLLGRGIRRPRTWLAEAA